MRPGLCVMLVLLLILASRPPGLAGATDLKRDFAIPKQQVEAGIFVLVRKTLLGRAETTVSLPVKWTRFHSDSLDFELEGWVSHTAGRRNGWYSVLAAPGFTYWFDGRTSVTPFLRLGFAHDGSAPAAFLVYGADVLLKRTFDIAPGDGAGQHRFIEAEIKGGFLGHAALGGRAASFSHQFVNLGAAYDLPILAGTWDASHRKRAKFGFRIENHFGSGRPADRYFLVTVSLRREAPETSRLIRKLDLAFGVDEGFRPQVSAGFVAGF